jgi:hypothetical protein
MKLEIFAPDGLALDSSRFAFAERLPDLSGKVLGEISNRLWEADRIFEELRASLKARFSGIRFVPWSEFPHHADTIQDSEDLPRLVREAGCDAVIGASAA